MNLKRRLLLPTIKIGQTVHITNVEDTSLQFLMSSVHLTAPFWGCHSNQISLVSPPVFFSI